MVVNAAARYKECEMLLPEYAELKGFLLFFTTNLKKVVPTPTGNIWSMN
jgi:hypothetical protein